MMKRQKNPDEAKKTPLSRDRVLSTAFWIQLGANIIAVIAVVGILFQINATSAQNVLDGNAVVDRVGQELTIHAIASAERSCATMKSIVFIIEKGYARSHRLGASPPEPESVKRRLEEFVELSCKVVPVNPMP